MQPDQRPLGKASVQHDNVIIVTRDELLEKVANLREQHGQISRLPSLREVEAELDQAYFLLGGCPHEYDDDWPFRDPEIRHLAPGAGPGDLCVWCLEPKP